MRLRSLVAIAALGLALVALGTGFVLASDHLENKAAFLSLALTVGLSFLISGVIALWRRPDNRTGIYLVLVSYFWCLGGLTEASNDWIFTLGVLVNSFALGAFVQLLLAYPTGRLQGRRDMWLVIAAYGLVFVGSVGQLLVDPRPNPDCPDCMSTIAVTSSDTARTVVTGVVGVLALAAVVGVLTIVVTRFLRAKGALRRALGPVLGTGALVMGVLLVQLVVGVFSEDAAEPLYYLFLVTFGLVPVAFLAGVLRSRLARSGVGELLLELSQGTPIRDAIAHALRDPTLEIAYWLPDEGRYVSSDGRPLAEDGGRRVSLVEHAGRPTAALLHDPLLLDEPELVDSVTAAAGLWLDNERLQAKLRAQYEFLETIVNAAPSLLCSLDQEGRIANLNEASRRASGFEGAAPFHQAASFEHTFVNRRGEELTIAWSTAPLHDENGNVRNVICGGL